MSDPFFSLPDDSEWNACVGRQGTEENYVDGYIEAAIELADAVIEKKLIGQRDTLAMPILYNARHALELSLKMAINKLVGMEVLPAGHVPNHDIASHWKLLADGDLGDRKLRALVDGLKPYVDSLAKIDDDGQELRYAENRDGKQSLGDVSLVNIEVIRDSLRKLGSLLENLKYRVMELADERLTGTYTKDCSRADLIAIAKMLPPRTAWTDASFDTAKAEVMKQFNLGSHKFSDALNAIQGSRELSVIIDKPSKLAHLSDAHLLFVVQQWAKRHPAKDAGDSLGIDYFESRDWDAFQRWGNIRREVDAEVAGTLTPDEIADLKAIYWMGRNSIFGEHYEEVVGRARNEMKDADDVEESVRYIMEKTNLVQAVMRGLRVVGRPDLVAQVMGLAELAERSDYPKAFT